MMRIDQPFLDLPAIVAIQHNCSLAWQRSSYTAVVYSAVVGVGGQE